MARNKGDKPLHSNVLGVGPVPEQYDEDPGLEALRQAAMDVYEQNAQDNAEWEARERARAEKHAQMRKNAAAQRRAGGTK